MSGDRITTKDVYEVVNRLEDKLDRRLNSMEERIDKNESFRERAIAVGSVFVIFSNLLATWIWDRLMGR